MPDPRKMKAAAKRAADRRKNEKRFEGTPDTAETQFEAMQASKAKEMKHTVAQRGKYANPSSRSPACLLYTSPSPRDGLLSRMPSSA